MSAGTVRAVQRHLVLLHRPRAAELPHGAVVPLVAAALAALVRHVAPVQSPHNLRGRDSNRGAVYDECKGSVHGDERGRRDNNLRGPCTCTAAGLENSPGLDILTAAELVAIVLTVIFPVTLEGARNTLNTPQFS